MPRNLTVSTLLGLEYKGSTRRDHKGAHFHIMQAVYSRYMEKWEERLCFAATNRVVRPFEWGLDWVSNWPVSRQYPRHGHSELDYLVHLNRKAVEHSEELFGYDQIPEFELQDNILRFRSVVHTPHAANNIVHAKSVPAKDKRRAVLVLPHWNSHRTQHAALCRGLAKFGITALRLSLPYHDYRLPAETQRADYAVSSNIGRTLDATRQAILDVRCCIDWLEQEGYQSIGIVGTSLGSCYAYMAAAHDSRLRVNVFNHCSNYFADVVWTGLSTKHIQTAFEGNIELEKLREVWDCLSPVNYIAKYAAHPRKAKFIYTKYDTTFLPEFSKSIISQIGQTGVDHKVVELPCGHYTMGETPFKFIDGYHIISHFVRNL